MTGGREDVELGVAARQATAAAAKEVCGTSGGGGGGAILAALANHLTCAVCQDLPIAAHALGCGHLFCGLCLAEWMPRKQSCPTCREAVTSKLMQG